MSFWDKLNIRKSKVQYDLVVVADELREELIEAFRDDPRHHFQIVDDPAQVDADTAQLEVALVELVPNKARARRPRARGLGRAARDRHPGRDRDCVHRPRRRRHGGARARRPAPAR